MKFFKFLIFINSRGLCPNEVSGFTYWTRGRIDILTNHLQGLNSKGFLWRAESKFTAVKMGKTFHPEGMRIPATFLIMISIKLEAVTYYCNKETII